MTVPVPREHRGTFIGTGIGTADFKKRYRTTGTAVDFESTASKPAKFQSLLESSYPKLQTLLKKTLDIFFIVGYKDDFNIFFKKSGSATHKKGICLPVKVIGSCIWDFTFYAIFSFESM